MDWVRKLNKEKIACLAASALLVLTAYTVVAEALRARPLPVWPTVGNVELCEPSGGAAAPQQFARFWDFGPRNPFQPVVIGGRATGAGEGLDPALREGREDAVDTAADEREGKTGQRETGGGQEIVAGDAAQGDNRGHAGEGEQVMHTAVAAEGPVGVPFNLKGIIRVREKFALFEDKESGSLARCAVGDVLLGMTVRGICLTSVIVEDRHGNLYELKDAFGRSYD